MGHVDQDVQPAEFGHGRRDGSIDLVSTRDVTDDGEGTPSEVLDLLCDFLRVVRADLHDRHVGADLGQFQRHAAGDTAAATGDDGHLAIQ